MRRTGPWLLPLLLLLLTGTVALFKGSAAQGFGAPLSHDTGPAGAAALARYLEGRGHELRVIEEGLPGGGSGAWILAAPSARVIQPDAIDRLAAFVKGGGTLVVLMPPLQEQPYLADWLALTEGPRLLPDFQSGWVPSPDVTLSLGSDPEVGALVLAPGPTVRMEADGALAVARRGPAVGLWRWPSGDGSVWVAAGPSLIENRRLELGAHLAFWEGLAAGGPVTLIESFHVPPGPVAPSRALGLTAAQLVLCLLLAGWVLGPRLGPARPTPVVHHRSSLESVRAFGWLLRRSRVEPELLAAHLARLRQLGHERLAVPLSEPTASLARAVETRCGRSAAWAQAILTSIEEASRQSRVRPARYAELMRGGAELEQVLLGIGTSSRATPRARAA